MVAGIVAAAAALTHAFGEPGPSVVYTPTGSGPRVTAVPLGAGSGGRGPWKLTVSFRCEGQTVDVVSDGTDVTSAPPGTWVSTKDGLVAVDGSGAPAVRLRDVRGALAAHGTTVWVLDRGAGGLVRVQGG